MSLVTQTNGDARLTLDPANGGRVASLQIGDHELLVTDDPSPIGWGIFPMVPWAGRIRHGRFSFRGRQLQMPIDMPPHAVHGVAYTQAWDVTSEADGQTTMECDLDQRWPFGGHVAHTIGLDDDGVDLRLRLTAGEQAMPFMLGWHPWFNRHIDGRAADLQVDAESLWELDDEGIPTGELVPPGNGPWDDCMTGMRQSPGITWPRLLTLTVTSDSDQWVIFNERPNALCIEPQSAAPDVFNRELGDEHVLEPGEQATATARISWQR